MCTPHSEPTGRLQVSTQEVSEEEFKRVWATNVIGLFNFSRALAPIIAEGVWCSYRQLPS